MLYLSPPLSSVKTVVVNYSVLGKTNSTKFGCTVYCLCVSGLRCKYGSCVYCLAYSHTTHQLLSKDSTGYTSGNCNGVFFYTSVFITELTIAVTSNKQNEK